MQAMRMLMIATAAIATSACATVDRTDRSVFISPVEAIESAAAAAPQGVLGQFSMRVRGSGRKDGNIYLNSEADYRDQRSLTIAILPSAMEGLATRYGSEADAFLIGKRIVVTGEARRTQIRLTHYGRPTGKFYYQTHVRVSDPDQLTILAGED